MMPLTPSPIEAPAALRWLLAVVACGSVVPLLAWVSGFGRFDRWAAFTAVPALATIAVVGWRLGRSGRWPGTRTGMTAGALGGLLGALGYDLFRVPFVFGTGRQLLAPIDSYGVLLVGAETSSALTGFLGWAYHIVNGIGFGVAYGLVARNRRLAWAVTWAMVLETATVVSGFASTYGLRAADGLQVVPIAIAFAAHVPFGLTIGWAVRDSDRVVAQAREVTRRPVVLACIVVVVTLAVWQRPFLPDAAGAAGAAVAPGPSAVVVDGRFRPTWLRVAPGKCATVRNDDDRAVDLGPFGSLDAGATTKLCGRSRRQAERVQVDQRPFSGGWLLTDPAAD